MGQGEADLWWSQELWFAVLRVSWRFAQGEVPGPEGLDSPVLFVEEVEVEPAQQHEVVGFGAAHVDCIRCGESCSWLGRRRHRSLPHGVPLDWMVAENGDATSRCRGGR